MINYNGIHYLLIEFAFTRILGLTFSLFLKFFDFCSLKIWDFLCLICDLYTHAFLGIRSYVFFFVSLPIYIVSFGCHSYWYCFCQGKHRGPGTFALAAQGLQLNCIICFKDIFHQVSPVTYFNIRPSTSEANVLYTTHDVFEEKNFF